MFGFDVGVPFTRSRQEKAEMKKVAALQEQQHASREQKQQGNWESQQRVHDAMRTATKNNKYQPGKSSNRSQYQFEADEEDERIESSLDKNLDAMSSGLTRLQAMVSERSLETSLFFFFCTYVRNITNIKYSFLYKAMASGEEVQRQTTTLDRISDKTNSVNDRLAYTTEKLRHIK
jgi:hypothetical protein